MRKKLLLGLFYVLVTSFCYAQSKYFVTASSLNARSAASTSASKIGTLMQGQIISVYRIDNGWAMIQYENMVAYVSAQYIAKLPDLEQNTSADVVPSISKTSTLTDGNNTCFNKNNPTEGRIVQKGEYFYVNGMLVAKNYKELELWIKNNHTDIYDEYSMFEYNASVMYKTGLILTPVGIVVGGCIGGGILAAHGSEKTRAAGIACVIIGSAIFSVGVPLFVVGTVRRNHNTLEAYYNEQVSSYAHVPLRLELQSSVNGIGLAFKF